MKNQVQPSPCNLHTGHVNFVKPNSCCRQGHISLHNRWFGSFICLTCATSIRNVTLLLVNCRNLRNIISITSLFNLGHTAMIQHLKNREPLLSDFTHSLKFCLPTNRNNLVMFPNCTLISKELALVVFDSILWLYDLLNFFFHVESFDWKWHIIETVGPFVAIIQWLSLSTTTPDKIRTVFSIAEFNYFIQCDGHGLTRKVKTTTTTTTNDIISLPHLAKKLAKSSSPPPPPLLAEPPPPAPLSANSPTPLLSVDRDSKPVVTSSGSMSLSSMFSRTTKCHPTITTFSGNPEKIVSLSLNESKNEKLSPLQQLINLQSANLSIPSLAETTSNTAKTSDLAKIAKTSDLAKIAKTSDLSKIAKTVLTSDLAKTTSSSRMFLDRNAFSPIYFPIRFLPSEKQEKLQDFQRNQQSQKQEEIVIVNQPEIKNSSCIVENDPSHFGHASNAELLSYFFEFMTMLKQVESQEESKLSGTKNLPLFPSSYSLDSLIYRHHILKTMVFSIVCGKSNQYLKTFLHFFLSGSQFNEPEKQAQMLTCSLIQKIFIQMNKNIVVLNMLNFPYIISRGLQFVQENRNLVLLNHV